MPASSIQIGFVDKFRADFIMLAQQQMSRLRPYVRTDPDMLEGRFGYYDRIGAVNMTKRTARHQDTNIVEVPHSRRRVSLSDFEMGHLLDKQDLKKLSSDPKSKYMKNALAAANRQIDDLIIQAATANSFSIDEDGAATPIALPAGNVIAAGGTGLTLAKLLTAREILGTAEAEGEDGQPEILVFSARQRTTLLNTTEVKSKDFNAVQALVKGEIDEFLGFKFIRTERLLRTGTTRRCLAFQPNAIGLAIGEDVEVDIGPRRDKGNATQLLVTMQMDATRVEDERIVAIDCTE